MTIGWREIEGPGEDGELVLLAVEIGTVWVVRNGYWSDGDLWDIEKFESRAEARGWWAPVHSVTAEKLEGLFKPTHWAPVNLPEGKDDSQR